MLPDRVSNPGPLTYESDALPIALRGPAIRVVRNTVHIVLICLGGDGLFSSKLVQIFSFKLCLSCIMYVIFLNKCY